MTRKFYQNKPYALAFLWMVLAALAGGCQEDPPPVVEKTVEEPAEIKRAKEWANAVLDTMGLERKIGQLVMLQAPAELDTVAQERLSETVNHYGIGGLVLGHAGEREAQKSFVVGLRDRCRLPLWVGLDVDEKWTEARGMPSLLTLGATNTDTLARDFGTALGAECRYLGGQMVFVSAAKVIPKGAYWEDGLAADPEIVQPMGHSLMNGLEEAGIMPVLRGLPAAAELAESPRGTDFESWKRNELRPLRHFIKDKSPAVQSSHFRLAELDSLPVSLSHRILHTLLSDQMDYAGFVFSPPFQDSSLFKVHAPGEAEALALAAGTDVLVGPSDVGLTVAEARKLIEKGQLKESDLDERVRRVLVKKALAGLDTLQASEIGWPHESPMIALKAMDRKISESALTLLADGPNRLPFKRLESTKYATLSIGTNRKTAFQLSMDPFAKIDHFVLGSSAKTSSYDKQLTRLGKYNYVAVSLHPDVLHPDSGRHLPNHIPQFLKDLQAETRLVLVNFAAPEVLADLDSIDVLVHACDDRKTTEEVAGQFLFGAVAATGNLPYNASEAFATGAGLARDKVIRLKNTIPEELGVDPSMLTKIDSIVNGAIYRGTFPGCQILAAKDGKVFFHKAFGYHDYERSRRVHLDDIYDIASVTKIAATTLMAMWSYDQDSLRLDSALRTYLPELDSSFITIKDITPKELLIHKAGLPSGLPVYKYYTYMDSVDSVKTVFYANNTDSVHTVPVADHLYFNANYMDSIWNRARQVKLINYGRYKYSDMSMFLMKMLLERLHDTKLDKFVRRKFYNPMGLKTICYHPLDRFSQERVAPTEKDRWWRKQQLRGHVHDPSTALFGGVGGQAGLFSNARDIATLMQMLLNEGTYGGRRFISRGTVRKFTSRQAGSHRGLGFDMQLATPCDGKGMCCASASAMTFGHTGFTGTCAWADPENDIVYVFLSNRVYPTAQNKKINIYRVRQGVQQVIYDALGLGLPPEENLMLADEKAPEKTDSSVVAGTDSSDCADC